MGVRNETNSPPVASYKSVNARFVGDSLIQVAMALMNIAVVSSAAIEAAKSCQLTTRIRSAGSV